MIQTAAELILEPIFEADMNDAAYGYRPGRNAIQAVQEVHKELARGRTEVVDADLSKYFDTIPHPELMKCLLPAASMVQVCPSHFHGTYLPLRLM